MRAAQSARLRVQQPTCQLGHVICVQAQSTRLRTRQPHQSRQSAACSISTIRTLVHAATLGCGDSDTTAVAQSTRLRTRLPHQSRQSASWHQHNPRVCAHSNRSAGAQVPSATSTIRAPAHATTLGYGDSDTTAVAQSTLLRARQPDQSRQSAAWYQHNPRACAHSNAGSSSMAPAVMRYGPHTCTHDNNQRHLPSPSRDTSPVAHGTPTPTPQHVSCMKMRYASWLDWTNVFSLGAGDKHGRDSQAD